MTREEQAREIEEFTLSALRNQLTTVAEQALNLMDPKTVEQAKDNRRMGCDYELLT